MLPRTIVTLAALAAGCGRLGFDTSRVLGADAGGDGGDGGGDADAALAPGVIAMGLGNDHTCVVLSDRTLWCWGFNREGQLGLGDTADRHAPTQVGTDADWQSIAAGGAGSANGHTCAIKTDHSLWCWGRNVEGQLGFAGAPTAPARVGTASWREVTCGWLATCGLQLDGSLWCWGDNLGGELGLGDLIGRATPNQVGSRTDWTHVDAGLQFACARANDGTAWCWGRDDYGELGNSMKTPTVSSPTQLPGTDWNTVAALEQHACGIRAGGALWCWGFNLYGQLGLGDSGVGTERTVPTPVGSTTWNGIGGAGGSSIGLQTTSLWRWGSLVAAGPFTPGADATPVAWREVSNSHGAHSCAVTMDGHLYCWGSDQYGELGDGTTSFSIDNPHLVPLPLP